MTLGEYYRLLSAAEKSERHQLSLILQALLTMRLKSGELKLVTVEAVRSGEVTVGNRQERIISVPDKLRNALLDYIDQNSLSTGPVFITVHGRPIERSNLLRQIKKTVQGCKGG